MFWFFQSGDAREARKLEVKYEYGDSATFQFRDRLTFRLFTTLRRQLWFDSRLADDSTVSSRAQQHLNLCSPNQHTHMSIITRSDHKLSHLA